MTAAAGRAGESVADQPQPASPSAKELERWLVELELEPVGSAERERVRSWDLRLDGRRRLGVSMTLILDRVVGLVVWVHYAPPLADSLRKTYRQLLRWNDELPFVKFAVAEDDRPVLSDEVPAAFLNRESLGLTVARLLAVCDLLYPESAKWVDRISRQEAGEGDAGVRLLNRYAHQLAELAAGT